VDVRAQLITFTQIAAPIGATDILATLLKLRAPPEWTFVAMHIH
jgi:hypothetical protein